MALPDNVHRFIQTSIPSVPYLEALLIVRVGQHQTWDSESLARRLYVPKRKAQALLVMLKEHGVAVVDSKGYVYRPEPELAAVLDELERQYSMRLREVTQLIHQKVDARAVQFAEAFRWKKGT